MERVEESSGAEFSAQQWQDVDGIIDQHRGQPGALIPVLEEVQAVTGYLPAVVQRRVARGLGLPLSRVYGVVTFYSFFTMKPRGRHQIRICTGTACHVRGAQRNVNQLKTSLGIEIGECTDDREFGLETVRCLGACGLAPVLVIDQDTHRQVKKEQLPQILRQYQGAAEVSEG